MPESYKECICCSLPYIDEVNGREGRCDFCTTFVIPTVAEAVGNHASDTASPAWRRPGPS
jgi:hypothetical protein